ncbi:transporter substrate-binding domain-containing protein [Affinibrenneria salicis]|uniref:Transporter substrate-binding domain-containing protein n=1 Tax=Affinibrenneria salicis TaxID=2590031 RepID=A0A5J5G248_9GAMM|nr:transporter substrate-binding domain-containing protein [Affinibrenneria salicis]KAA9000620.1 transporter substrate-binding domain-containing protein [Affinibrenneria salicis]
MKNLRTWAMSGALLFSLAAHGGETLDRVTHTGVMRNVLLNNYPPFGFIDDNNQLAGFDVDVARAVAERLGVRLELITPGWETIVSGRWQGRWDTCICSMTPNSERAKVLDFVTPYYSSPAVLVVHKDDNRIHGAADLTGKKVGTGIGSSYENYLHKSLVIPGAKPLEYPFGDVQVIPTDESMAFQNLALGPGKRLDAVVSDLATANDRIKKIPRFRVVAELYSEPNWVVTDKGDPQWDQKLTETVQSLRADGTLAKISQRWLGEDVTREQQ